MKGFLVGILFGMVLGILGLFLWTVYKGWKVSE